MVTVERVRDLLNYNPFTGDLTWRVRCGSRGMPGKKAGSPTKNGYVEITFCGNRFYAHRVIWFYVHGVWPKQIDHKNGIRTDNRLNNLRAADAGNNAQNLRKRTKNTSGYTGAFRSRGRWRSQIKCGNKQHFLGVFDSPEEAHAAYATAKKQLHNFQPSER